MEVPTLKSSTGTLPQPLPDPVSPATAHPKTVSTAGAAPSCAGPADAFVLGLLYTSPVRGTPAHTRAPALSPSPPHKQP